MARSLSTGLSTLLAGRAFLPVDLYEITIGGTTYRYTSHVSDVTGVAPAAVATYTAGMLECGTQRTAAGLVVEDLEVIVQHGGTETVGGVTWAVRANRYDLDGVAFRRLEGFLDSSTGLLVGAAVAFSGEVSEVEPSSTRLRLVVSVPTKRFESRFPTLQVQPGCVWEFGSTGCGYTGTKDFTATLATGSDLDTLRVTAVPSGLPGSSPGMQEFLQGFATVAGYRRTVVDVVGDTPYPYLVVSPPFPAGVVEAAIGSSGALALRLGCVKTAYACHTNYGRLAGFLGAPLAPSSREST